MDTEYRLYENGDYDDLLEMIVSLYREDPEGEPVDEEKINRTIREYRKNPEKISIYMLKRNQENLGYAILVFFWSNEYGGNIITIDEIYVREGHRSKGLAAGFFSFLEKMENKVALQLESTPSNQKALTYYKRLGFVPSQNTHLIKQIKNAPSPK